MIRLYLCDQAQVCLRNYFNYLQYTLSKELKQYYEALFSIYIIHKQYSTYRYVLNIVSRIICRMDVWEIFFPYKFLYPFLLDTRTRRFYLVLVLRQTFLHLKTYTIALKGYVILRER